MKEQPWASSPRTRKEIVGNEGAIRQLRTWVTSWEKGPPKQRAAFLYGAPGIGKTSSVVALANDLGYDLFEVNASDCRTKKRLEKLVGRAALQTVTIIEKRRMILFDELEGISGVQDRGGISAIAAIIKETRVPIVLVAMSIGERWEEKFRPLVDLSILIKYHRVSFGEMVKSIRARAEEFGVTMDEEALEFLADNSKGDLRSALNDLEAIAQGKEKVTLSDCESLSLMRDRKDYTPDALMKIFSAKTLMDARNVISSVHIPYDDLFDWIYENLPLVLDDPSDLAEGMNALSRADIHQTRARRTQNYRLIKYMFDEMTGGVALSRRNSGWNIPYFRSPQLVWRYRRTWASRRRRRSIAEQVAQKCHISTRKAVAELIPLMKVIYQDDPSMAEGISRWLKLDNKEEEWLRLPTKHKQFK